jgi:hypothetical protein
VLLRRAVIAASVSLSCGPTVPIGDDGGETSDGSSTMPPTTVGSATAMTASTTITTTSMTTASDESTSIDSTTSGADESSADSNATGFIQSPDGGSCFTHCSYCDVWAQDCVDGEKCMPWANDGGDAWNSTRCSPIDPDPAAIGEPCVVERSGTSGFDNCGVSAMCWGVDPVTLEGTCVGFCSGSEANPQCPDGLACVIAFDGIVIPCVPPCDPLAPTCAADEACMYTGQDPPFARFACLPTPPFVPHGYGEACDGDLQLCASGLACVVPEHVPGCADLGCCTTVGDVAAPPVCPDVTQSCIPFDDESMQGPCYCGVQ